MAVIERSAEKWKIEGNRLMNANFLEAAKLAYMNGIAICNGPMDDMGDSGIVIELSKSEDYSILQALHLNLSRVFQKLESWEDAVVHTSIAIKIADQITLSTEAVVKPKALFRRGICQENLALMDCTERKFELMRNAKTDIEECLLILNGIDSEDGNAKKLVLKKLIPAKRAYSRIKMRLKNSLLMHSVESKIDISDSSHQRQTVERLLEQSIPPKEGEAFILIDYRWWKRWCELVSFTRFDLLPEGGSPISKELYKALMDQSNDSDDDSSASSIKNNIIELPTLEKLNAISLLFNINEQYRLKPGLIRGYHYEILPREIYSALRSWYDEEGIRIVRRASLENGRIQVKLYPLLNEKNYVHYGLRSESCGEETLRCSACRFPSSQKCRNCLSVYYCSTTCQEIHWPYHKYACRRFKNNQSPNLQQLKKEDFGRCGLGNLGNTCFMNSSLQCLSHAYPLTKYFLKNDFIDDINYSNPLGTKGNLARAYDATLKELYWSNKTSINPTQLKRSIALFQPRFAGYSQEDAPEFLAYLLDGLHEDLNRIKNKPYITLPDAETGYENVRIAAAEACAADRLRNCSVLRDNFYGQYQSTCICPECNQSSVTFDPFNVLNVHLPNEMERTIPILYFEVNNDKCKWGIQPTQFGISVNQKTSNLGDIKQKLSSLCSVPFQDLTLCDVYDHKICNILSNMSEGVAKIQNNDFIVAYNMNSEREDTVQVVVSHRRNGENMLHSVLPYFVAFEPNTSCSHVKDHLWLQFRRYLRKNDSLVISQLKVRVVDSKDQHIAICTAVKNTIDSSIFPYSTETLQDIFGRDCANHYLFLNIEWNDASLLNRNDAILEMTKHESLNASNKISLEQCIDNFTKPERLDKDNMYYCSKCKKHVHAMKTMKICQLPNILIIHLKRFEFKTTFRRNKLETFVDCPINGLDLKEIIRSKIDDSNIICNNIPAVYDLFGVTNHYGRMGFGHYTASCRQWDDEGMSNEWTLFDDSNTSEIDKKSVVSSAAYVLFYRRRI